MAVTTLGKVDHVSSQLSTPQLEETRQRRHLDRETRESFERGSGTDLSGYAPPLDAPTRASIEAFYGAYGPSERVALQAASLELGKALLNAGPAGATSSALQEASATTLATYLTTTGSDDRAQTSQDFMRMALGGMEAYLRGFAEKVQANTGIAKELRTTLTELRDMLADWPAGADKQHFTWTEVTYDDRGNPTLATKEADLTKQEAQQLLERLEEQLATTSEMSEIAKFDLQAKYQDYQQAVQTLAGIQKQVHDDASKIIHNLKA